GATRVPGSFRSLPAAGTRMAARAVSGSGPSPRAVTGPASAVAWIESLSPWPEGGFGLERMHELLERLGHPERAYPAIHVVGTNGKSTATRTIAALLRAEGLRAGAYTSPHVSGWAERLDTDPLTLGRALERIRQAAEATEATQFEAL